MTDLLTQPNEIKALLREAAQADTLYLDTEFHWRQSYYPHACLFQIKFSEEAHLVELLNFNCQDELAELLQSDSRKIFHSPSQDLWVLKLLCGVNTRNVLDTQVAAAFLGSPAQVSLAGLMQKFCNRKLSKGQQVSNWKKRPLSPAQLEYALNDVIYLEELFSALEKELKNAHRESWFLEECDTLFSGSSNNEKNLKNATLFRKVKGWKILDQHKLTILAELCAAREKIAAEIDLTPRLVVDDETMLNIARRLPSNQKTLLSCGFNEKFTKRLADTFIDICMEMKNLPSSKWIKNSSRGRLSDVEDKLASRLTKAVNIASDQLNIEAPFIFNRSRLQNAAVRFYKDQNRLSLSGWRAQQLQAPFDKIFDSLS